MRRAEVGRRPLLRSSAAVPALLLSLVAHAALLGVLDPGSRRTEPDAGARPVELTWSMPPASPPVARPEPLPLEEPVEPDREPPRVEAPDPGEAPEHDPRPVVERAPLPAESALRRQGRIRARLAQPEERPPVAHAAESAAAESAAAESAAAESAAAADASEADENPVTEPPPEGEASTTVVAAEPAPENRPPRYPGPARRRGWEGTVVVGVEVAVDGTVRRAWIARSSGHGILDEAARDAVLGWVFRPGTVDGEPTVTETDVSVGFRLRE